MLDGGPLKQHLGSTLLGILERLLPTASAPLVVIQCKLLLLITLAPYLPPFEQ